MYCVCAKIPHALFPAFINTGNSHMPNDFLRFYY